MHHTHRADDLTPIHPDPSTISLSTATTKGEKNRSYIKVTCKTINQERKHQQK